MPQKGFSSDGFIIDQDYFEAYPYRGSTSNRNGCGWIAVFDLLHAQGRDIPFEEVLNGLNCTYPAKMPGPTPMRAMRKYLSGLGSYRVCRGRKSSLQAACTAPSGILRYWEGQTPHFVPFLHMKDVQICRFFNVADGQEDMTSSMEYFFTFHCRHGNVWAIVPADSAN